jgi:uncharacterized protein (DUF1501 family)
MDGTIDRRRLLAWAGGGALVLALPRAGRRAVAFAEPTGTKPCLVVLFLRGGADPLHALVPYGDPRYAELRPTISIGAEAGEDGPGVVRLDKTFGLHPAMAPLERWWREGKVAAVLQAGSPHGTRSHFDAQDFMEYAAPGVRTIRDGWLNRFLAATSPPSAAKAPAAAPGEAEMRALALQPLLPRSLRGTYPVVAVPDRDVLENEALLDLFDGVYGNRRRGEEGDPMSGARAGDDPVLETGQRTVGVLRRLRRYLEGAGAVAAAGYPKTALGMRMRAVARLVKTGAGLEVAAIDVPGWDHHVNQGDAEGSYARLVGDVASSVSALLDDVGPAAATTMVLVMSEFGRTVAENGNNGTDHGHGGYALLCGGKVKGGRIHGEWDGLSEKSLYEGRDLRVTTDFRDLMADVLRNHLGFDPPKGFFPGHEPKKVKGLF